MRPSERAARRPARRHAWRPASTATPRARAWSRFGHTRVLVTASLDESVPGFLRGRGQGWVTAEYGMLPRATHTRGRREAAEGKQSGRSQEIQRLIGRSLRAVTDLKALGERQITLDCDVIQADGGTRTAAITGAWVALRLATRYLLDEGVITTDPILDQVAAISCGVFAGHAGARPRLRGGQPAPRPTPTSCSPAPATSSRSRPPARSAASPAPSSRRCSPWPSPAHGVGRAAEGGAGVTSYRIGRTARPWRGDMLQFPMRMRRVPAKLGTRTNFHVPPAVSDRVSGN